MRQFDWLVDWVVGLLDPRKESLVFGSLDPFVDDDGLFFFAGRCLCYLFYVFVVLPRVRAIKISEFGLLNSSTRRLLVLRGMPKLKLN